METVAPTARRPADQVLLPALERGLDALAQQVRADLEPPQFFRDLLRLLVHTARADEAAIWLRTGDGLWNRVSLNVASTDGAAASQAGLAGSEWLTATLNSGGPEHTRHSQDDGEQQRIATAIRQGGVPVGVLDALFYGASLPASVGTLSSYCGALAELAGDFLVQHELRLLRRERLEWMQWEQWLTTLQNISELPRLADLISHDGRALTTSDRMTLLRLSRGSPRVASVSGVDLIDPRSSTVQAHERLAALALRTGDNVWCGLDAPVATELQSAWQRLQHAAGTFAAGVLPLRGPDGVPTGCLICERFQPVADGPTWRAKCEALQRFTRSGWSAAVERAAGPWTRLWRGGQHALSPWNRTVRRTALTGIAIGGIAAALVGIRAPLVITGEGKLLPAERRDIFASATGIVEEVRVQHGTSVRAGDTLLVLRDPNVDLEATRVAGELATVRTRLNVVQATRISGGSAATGDPTQRAQQLTGEEEELRQRLESLARQEALLEAERKSWTLASPIDGQVLTWDVEPLLAGRPVQRGHVLLEVGATAGEWVIEVRVRERDAGAVIAAWNEGRNAVPVEFVPLTGLRWIGRGAIRDVAHVTDANERGESSVRLIVAFDRDQAPELRSGKTVLPRIACGEHPLGYVWFRDLIDAAQRAWWQWW